MSEVKITLAGELRSGKSTIAEYAEERYFMVPFAFGDKLKEGFHDEYPQVPREPKPRKGYQLYGQLKRYAHGENHWLNKCFDHIEYIRKIARNYNIRGSELEFMPIITDARQPNEFERCREEGYAIVKIVTSTDVRIKRAKENGDNFNLEDLNHETEQHIKDLEADYIIYNNGSKEELYAQFDKIIADIRG